MFGELQDFDNVKEWEELKVTEITGGLITKSYISCQGMSFIERQWRAVDIIGKVTSYLQFEKLSSREENTL